MAEGRRGREGRLVGTALPGAVANLLPKLRKTEALRRFISLLPAELHGLAAPHELRLAPGTERLNAPAAQVSTLFVYVASATVGVILERLAPQLLAELNASLPYPLAEALRCEPASPQKIAQQLNNLTVGPD
jgi:hypothetical protein